MSGPGFSFVPTTSTSGGGTTYTGTANQVVVTGTVLSTPQDIATASTPQFGGLGIGVAAACNKLRLAAAGIIDFDNGDVTLTHSNDKLTLAGGVLVVPDGTAAAPGLQFASTATGFYYTAGAIGYVRAGTEILRLNTDQMLVQSGFQLNITSGALGAAIDTTISRSAPGVTRFGKATAAADGCIAFTNFTNLGCGQFHEMTSAPQGGCNAATVYAVDNGAGKTQLMVVFQTGSAIELAIEP